MHQVHQDLCSVGVVVCMPTLQDVGKVRLSPLLEQWNDLMFGILVVMVILVTTVMVVMVTTVIVVRVTVTTVMVVMMVTVVAVMLMTVFANSL